MSKKIRYAFLTEDWQNQILPLIEKLPGTEKALFDKAKRRYDMYCQGFIWGNAPDDFHETELGRILDNAVAANPEKADFYELTYDGQFKNVRFINGLDFLALPLE